jgi:subtilisin family serine protease
VTPLFGVGVEDALGLVELRAAGGLGRGQVVAVLDTGAESGLAGSACFTDGACAGLDRCVPPAANCGRCEGELDCVHGVAMGGVVRAIAPQATLLAVRVTTHAAAGAPVGREADLVAALRWLADRPPAVVNLSLEVEAEASARACAGGPLAGAVAALVRAGTLVVAASGGGAHPDWLPAPACLPEVVSVGPAAVPYRWGEWWADRSPALRLLAPGVEVPVRRPGGGTGFMSGPSVAAAHAAGLFAAVRSVHPELTPGELVRRVSGPPVPAAEEARVGRAEVRVPVLRYAD